MAFGWRGLNTFLNKVFLVLALKGKRVADKVKEVPQCLEE